MLRQFQRFIRVMDCYADTIRELTTIYCLACLKLRLMSFTIMKLVALVIVLSVAGINSVKAEIKSYEGFKVYAVHYETKRDLESIKYFEHNPLVDFWSSPGINKTNHISVDPSMQLAFEEFLANGNFDFKVLVENVQETMASYEKNEFFDGNFTTEATPDFSHYWTLVEIESYVEFLSQSTDLHVKKVLIGKSYEGRNIYGLTISLDDIVGNQPILFIDAGIHAREWASHMSVLFLLHQLVENYSENSEMLTNVDWVVVPVVNPDGYAYTFTNDRFWRKNRRPINEDCVGVDINRNFKFGWKAAGPETSPCSSTYPGPSPHSEPEAKALADFMVQFKNKLKVYVSMHSYASFLLYPFSFDFLYISNWKQHQELCKLYVDTLNRITKFQPYTFGHSASEFYLANGVSDDHVIGEADARMSIVIELPGGGTRGFDFPEEEIEDLVKETFQGLKQIGIYVGDNF